MGIGENASSLFYEPFTPFCSGRLFDLISTMPREAQYEGCIQAEWIRVLWPELLKDPFSRSTRKASRLLPKWMKNAMKKCILRLEQSDS